MNPPSAVIGEMATKMMMAGVGVFAVRIQIIQVVMSGRKSQVVRARWYTRCHTGLVPE